MSIEKFASELSKIKADTELVAKLKGAASIEDAVALAKGAGYDVTKEDLLKFKSSQDVELNDEALEGVAGGGIIKEGYDDVISIIGSWY